MWKNKRPKGWKKLDDVYFTNRALPKSTYGLTLLELCSDAYEAGADAMFKEFGKLNIVEILKILAEYFPDRYVRLGEDNEG